jgi:hypothetical protein
MAEIKLGEPFGIDATALANMDLDLAVSRILNDVRTDFIFAPHLSLIYRKAKDELIKSVTSELKAGKYMPGIPLQMEVPKTYRIPVESTGRMGPAYSRPGSILLPKDRVFYQALADKAAKIIDKVLDGDRSFSHELVKPDSATMFLPTRKCWQKLQTKLAKYAKMKSIKYVMKLDIANYFSSINQHTLVNVLEDNGLEKTYSTRLEATILRYTGDRSSRGILQGIYPSDLLGNFYMAPVDRFLKDRGVPSARYVDDLYVFVQSVDEAESLLRDLIPFLRSYDLSLNESKCRILPKHLLHTMEPDLEALFNEAVEEISSQIDDDDFEADYGFQSEWDDDDDESDEEDSEDLELKATKALFDSIDQYPGQEENVERFCLPLFAKADSDYAIEHVINAFRKRPSMSQIYSAYLAKFIETDGVRDSLVKETSDQSSMDWQRMWTLAALMQGEPEDEEVKIALDIARDGARHDAIRAVGAYFVGMHGDHGRRTDLRTAYPQMPQYVQSAVYASSRFWKGAEKNNARAMWAGHSPLHTLVTDALSK